MYTRKCYVCTYVYIYIYTYEIAKVSMYLSLRA